MVLGRDNSGRLRGPCWGLANSMTAKEKRRNSS